MTGDPRQQGAPRPSNGVAMFVIGGVLLLIWLVFTVLFWVDRPDSAAGRAAWELITWWGANIAGAVGVLLIALGFTRRARLRARQRQERPD
ncbi:phage holin family protein [Gryllotalpicola ginsengisoli]|uniref:phage holin family protein n=1 Tax=Gryllotalpicola ginsengisoli TaxID=444608 RepID=UPI000410BC8B|nr:phage holin family protein [Gryllotalpicola ginsengisoli]